MNKIKTTLKGLLDKSKGNLSIREHICIVLIQKALNGSLDALKLIKEILNNETIKALENMNCEIIKPVISNFDYEAAAIGAALFAADNLIDNLKFCVLVHVLSYMH